MKRVVVPPNDHHWREAGDARDPRRERVALGWGTLALENVTSVEDVDAASAGVVSDQSWSRMHS